MGVPVSAGNVTAYNALEEIFEHVYVNIHNIKGCHNTVQYYINECG